VQVEKERWHIMRKDYEFGIAGVLWVKSVCNRMNKFMEEHREKWL